VPSILLFVPFPGSSRLSLAAFFEHRVARGGLLDVNAVPLPLSRPCKSGTFIPSRCSSSRPGPHETAWSPSPRLDLLLSFRRLPRLGLKPHSRSESRHRPVRGWTDRVCSLLPSFEPTTSSKCWKRTRVLHPVYILRLCPCPRSQANQVRTRDPECRSGL